MISYKVYLIKDKKDKILYVGLTKRPLSVRFSQHVSRKKLNRLDYKIELVQEDLTLEQAVKLEILLIKQYNLIDDGWNISPGSINGYSVTHSEITKKKLREIKLNKPVSIEHASKNRIARIGMKNTEHQKKMVSDKNSKKVKCLETGKIYKSAREAAKELKLQYSKISLVCNKKRKSTGGMTFIFV
jgi:hypothetical protein